MLPGPGVAIRWPIWSRAADDICYRIIDVEDAGCNNWASTRCDLLLPLTGEPDRAQRKMRHITRSKEKSNTCARAIGTIIDQVHQCFMDNEATISGPAVSPPNCWTRSPPPRRCAR